MNPFRCSPCNKSFSGKYQLARHLESALHAGKSLTCPHCSSLFNRSDALHAHIRTQHLKDSPYQCPECNKQCTSNYQLSQHLLVHSGARPLKCPKCPATFRYTQQLKEHENQHQGIKPYECPEPDCHKRFTRLQELKTHELYHSGEKPYECTKCDKRFPQHSHLVSHSRVHSGDRPFKCSKCSKKFKQSSHLRIHMSYHKGDKPCECKVCGEKFRLPHTLKSHMRRHTGEKPYKCPHCPKAFSQSSPLKYHIQKMHGDGQTEMQQCKKCSKAFPTQVQLKAHERNQHGNKKKGLSCVFCVYKCATLGELNKHIRRHNQEKLKTCQGPPGAEVTSTLSALSPKRKVNAADAPVNGQGKKLECKKCGKKMLHQRQLNGHMAIHKKKAKLTMRKKEKKVVKIETNKVPVVVLERLKLDPLMFPSSRVGDHNVQIELVTEPEEDLQGFVFLNTEQVRLGPRPVAGLSAVVEEVTIEEEEDDMPICEIKIESVRHVPQEELVKLQNLRPFQCDYCNKMYRTTEELARHAEMHGEMVVIMKPEPKFQPEPMQQQLSKKVEAEVVTKKKKKKLKKKKKVVETEGVKNKKPENLPNVNKTGTQENEEKPRKPVKKLENLPIINKTVTPVKEVKPQKPVKVEAKLVNKLLTQEDREKQQMPNMKDEDEMPKLYKATKESPKVSSRKSDELPPVLQMEVAHDEAIPVKKEEEKTIKTNLETNTSNKTAVTPVLSITCKLCNRTFGNKGALGFHMKKKHPPKPKMEPLKEQKSKSSSPTPPAPEKQEVAPPQVSEKPVPPPPAAKTYKCILCQYRTTEREALTLHAKLVHYGVNKHKCSSCWKAFPTEARLEEHLKSHDNMNKIQMTEQAQEVNLYL